MSTLKPILLLATIEFGYAYMNYSKGGWRDIVLLLLFVGAGLAYCKVAGDKE